MRAKLAWLAVVIALGGCGSATSSGKAGASPGIYVDPKLHASFRVPSGWSTPRSWFQRSTPWAARFDEPGGRVSVIAGQGLYAGINCAAAAKAALAKASGSSLDVDKEFELKASEGALSAGTGTTSSDDRQGFARYFCIGRDAVVVEASAAKSLFDDRRSQLESIADSVAYEANSQQVAIRPPVAPPAQTFFEHTVRFQGETLGQIAEWYTGSYDNWRKLSRYNEDTPVPNVVLKVGREIKIPTELVTRQDPLPAPKRRRAEHKGRTDQKAATELKPSEEEEAETTGVPKGEEEEAPALPPVIGPR